MFGPHAGEIWGKKYGQKYTNFELFDRKQVCLFKNMFDKAFTPFWKTFVQLKQ